MPVCERRCRECLYSAAKLVSDARRDEILEECSRSGRAFLCHKASGIDEYVVCRGFYDADASLAVVLAKQLGAARFVPVPT